MRRNIKTYLDLQGSNVLSIANVSDCLFMAVKDGVVELEVEEHELEMITKYMVYYGHWNWDKETFMGIKLIEK